MTATDCGRDALHVHRPLRLAVFDEVRFVDDHPGETEAARPARVAIENVVVDDDDVREGVEVVSVTVNDRRGAMRNPALDLALPVALDDVRHDDEQRERTRRLGGKKRLRGLAQTWFVGQKVRAVTRLRGFDKTRLVTHEVEIPGGFERLRFGQIHAGGLTALLESAEQRFDEFPVLKTPSHARVRRIDGRKERVREFGSTNALWQHRLARILQGRGG